MFLPVLHVALDCPNKLIYSTDFTYFCIYFIDSSHMYSVVSQVAPALRGAVQQGGRGRGAAAGGGLTHTSRRG